MNRSVQRARKPNYTKEETETLLNQLILYGHFLFNKSHPVNNQQKADVWASIAMQVNAVPNSAVRTVDELKHRWQDMAQRARHAIRKRPSHSLSNGGSAISKPVPFLNKILQILGESCTKSDKNLEETPSLLPSVDSTPYSSDSSATNIKEELDDASRNTTAGADVGVSNGKSASNGIKRSHFEATNCTNLTGENKRPNDGASSVTTTSSLTLNHFSSLLHNENRNQNNENIGGCQEKFESKRRRMKKSSNPRKTISSSSSYHLQGTDAPGYDDAPNHEPPCIGQKHIETFRSMVLDPESDIVMEVEDMLGGNGDAASLGSSLSTSNPPTAHQNDPLDFCDYMEDKCRSEYLQNQHQQWHNDLTAEAEGETSNHQRHNLPPGASNAHPTVFENSIQPPGLPSRLVNNNGNGKKIKNVHPSLPHFHGGEDRPAHSPLGNIRRAQKLREQNFNLDLMSKADLDRRCVISQILMQEQHTRNLLLEEQKLQLEIELLKGKFVCREDKSNGMGRNHGLETEGNPSVNNDDDTSDKSNGEENDDDEEGEEDEDVSSLMVSFGDHNNKVGDGSVSSNSNAGAGGSLFESDVGPGQDWEKDLQKNIGL